LRKESAPVVRTSDPHQPRRRHLRLLDPEETRPLPVAVPLLQPNTPVSKKDEILLTSLARRAARGDDAARDLLWRALAARFEPTIRRCGRAVWQPGWAWRNGRPWALDDLRQEAWLVFVDLIADWDRQGAFLPYVTAYFSWRLRNAMREMGPPRRAVRPLQAADEVAAREVLGDVEVAALLDALKAALSPGDADVLELFAREGLGHGEIARQLGISRRTVTRRWARIQRVAQARFGEDAPCD
jgi:RNA polymerase sigma factor (sigma-70 family)